MPLFEKPPQEVVGPTFFLGTDAADLITVTQAAVAANVNHGEYWEISVKAEGGDDTIVRDRTGGYPSGSHAHLFANVAGEGWEHIATLRNVSATSLNWAINDGSALHVEVGVVGDGAAGGLMDFEPFGPGPTTFEPDVFALG